MSADYGARHRFVQHPTQPFCGFEKWPGVICAEGPAHPLHEVALFEVGTLVRHNGQIFRVRGIGGGHEDLRCSFEYLGPDSALNDDGRDDD